MVWLPSPFTRLTDDTGCRRMHRYRRAFVSHGSILTCAEASDGKRRFYGRAVVMGVRLAITSRCEAVEQLRSCA